MIGLLAMAAALAGYPELMNVRGSNASAAEATQAARRCRAKDIRHDPLDDREAMLVIGRHNTKAAVECTISWLARNAQRLKLELDFVGNAARP
ncbi:hypothetical protein SPAN111604_06795 [Sphingomonas antarctica]|uniref:hypothetical protein n=1 Tax=Sphingomonas antarctica TaxID=2040274 RepID=UPI0039ECFCF7